MPSWSSQSTAVLFIADDIFHAEDFGCSEARAQRSVQSEGRSTLFQPLIIVNDMVITRVFNRENFINRLIEHFTD